MVTWVGQWCMIVVFPDYTYLLFKEACIGLQMVSLNRCFGFIKASTCDLVDISANCF